MKTNWVSVHNMPLLLLLCSWKSHPCCKFRVLCEIRIYLSKDQVWGALFSAPFNANTFVPGNSPQSPKQVNGRVGFYNLCVKQVPIFPLQTTPKLLPKTKYTGDLQLENGDSFLKQNEANKFTCVKYLFIMLASLMPVCVFLLLPKDAMCILVEVLCICRMSSVEG